MCRDAVILEDIRNAGGLVIEFVEGLDQATFLSDLKSQSAVIHQLLVMGEAVKRLSHEYRTAHQEIPWKLLAGMRDKLIHAYDSIDIDQVWQTAKHEIPTIMERMNQ